MGETDFPQLDAQKFPTLSGIERPFFEFWWINLVRPDDPQRMKWVEFEELQSTHVAHYPDRLRLAMPLEGARVLDVGCQNGATLVALSKRGAVPSGIEIDARCVEAAKIRMRCHGVDADVRAGSACSMPFPDRSFDGVVASNVIEHVESQVALISEVTRVLRPGGVLYLDGPNRLSLRNFWADPHYQMLGVSVLPGWLARAYVTKVRRFPAYDAETFPLASSVRGMLERHGHEILPDLDGKPARMPRLRALVSNLSAMFAFLTRRN